MAPSSGLGVTQNVRLVAGNRTSFDWDKDKTFFFRANFFLEIFFVRPLGYHFFIGCSINFSAAKTSACAFKIFSFKISLLRYSLLRYIVCTFCTKYFVRFEQSLCTFWTKYYAHFVQSTLSVLSIVTAHLPEFLSSLNLPVQIPTCLFQVFKLFGRILFAGTGDVFDDVPKVKPKGPRFDNFDSFVRVGIATVVLRIVNCVHAGKNTNSRPLRPAAC